MKSFPTAVFWNILDSSVRKQEGLKHILILDAFGNARGFNLKGIDTTFLLFTINVHKH